MNNSGITGMAIAPLQRTVAAITGTFGFRAVKYGYANARTKAMYATLLPKKDIDAMVEAKDVSEIVALLQRTYYGPDLIDEAFEFSKADLIEISLTRNFSRTLQKLIKISPKGDTEKIKKIYERYDVLNLKNLLLGIHLREDKEKIRLLLVESPAFGSLAIKRLAELSSVKALIESLKGTPYYRPLDQKLSEYEKTGEIEALILPLESYFYQKFASPKTLGFEIEKAIRELLVLEIDSKNAMLVLRGKKEGFSEQKILSFAIRGGKISFEALKKMAQAKTIEDAARTQNVFDFENEIAAFKNDNSLVHFETALEKKMAQVSLKELRRSTLSLSALVGFLFLKEKEIKTIRKIVRTKDFGFGPKEIMELVVA